MNATRTDIHRPAELVTENYSLRACFNARPGTDGRPATDHEMAMLDMARRAAATSSVGRGITQCHHCGVAIRWAAILDHTSGESIIVGETCLERFGLSSTEFHTLRKAAQLDREAFRIRTAVALFLAANPDLAWMGEKSTPEPHAANEFLCDVARKLRQYGELSSRQVTAVRGAVARDVERAAARATEATEPTAPVPTGRVTVTGEVVALRWDNTQWGSVQKMLVKVTTTDGAYKVWGSVPAGLDASRGDVVTMKATLERSDRDEAFGFFKRPSVK